MNEPITKWKDCRLETPDSARNVLLLTPAGGVYVGYYSAANSKWSAYDGIGRPYLVLAPADLRAWTEIPVRPRTPTQPRSYTPDFNNTVETTGGFSVFILARVGDEYVGCVPATGSGYPLKWDAKTGKVTYNGWAKCIPDEKLSLPV